MDGRRSIPLGDDPNCIPQDDTGVDFVLLSCSCRSDNARTSLTEFDNKGRRNDRLLGESGGESEVGECGGDTRVDVGEDDMESADFGKAWRRGDPS